MQTLAIILGIAAVVYVAFRLSNGSDDDTGPPESIDNVRIMPGFGIVTLPSGKLPPDFSIDALVRTRVDVWIKFCEVYKRTAVYSLSEIVLVWKMPHPEEHAAVELDRAKNTITLLIGGYDVHDERYWFALELHNLFRWNIGLPYKPVDDVDNQRYAKVWDYVEEYYG